jgi:hypothetical protein
VISTRIGLLAAEPFIDAAIEAGVDVHVVGTALVLHELEGNDAIRSTIDLTALGQSQRFRSIAHRFIELLLANPDMSGPYRRLRSKERDGSRRSTIRRLLGALPRLSAARVNRLEMLALQWVSPSRFPTQDVVVVSYTKYPHLLCARGVSVTTLMESWDHPTKRPAGYLSKRVIAWNEELGRDWIEFQGGGQFIQGYPVKLEWAISGSREAAERSHNETRRLTALYACAFTSAGAEGLFREEERLVDDLCRRTAQAGWDIIVKPKPTGPPGDFEDVVCRHSNASLGSGCDNVAGVRDYYLDDTYNRVRQSELDRADLVISAATTFGLDAACAGLPVLQLDLRSNSTYDEIAVASHYHHLDHYLLRDAAIVFDAGRADWQDRLVEHLRSWPIPTADHYTERMRDWVIPPGSKNDTARAAIAQIARTE